MKAGMRGGILALAATLAFGAAPAVAVEGVVGCGDFRAGWARALGTLDGAHPAPTYGPAASSGAEPIGGLAGIEGGLTCRDGLLGQLELASQRGPLLDRATAAVLMALDRDLGQTQAIAMAAALKAESESTGKEAMSGWGPYELFWAPLEGGRVRFTLNFPEN